MNNQLEYETPICNLRRLISKDNSDRFKLIVAFKNIKNFSSLQNQQTAKLKSNDKLEINTTINKVRSISSKINKIYQIDPTITEYELTIPANQQQTEEEEYMTNVKEIIELLLESTMKKVTINDKEIPLFKKIHFLLGFEENDNKIEFEFSSEEEAIAYLFTEMHDKSIEYLSNHFYEMIEHGNYKHFDERIMSEIIDNHFKEKEQKESNKNDEDEKAKFETIFNKLKTEYDSPKMILSILLRTSIDEYNDDMYSYIYEHLDDEIISEEFSQIINIVRQFLFSHIYKSDSSKETKLSNNKIECEYKGNELSGIITYLKGNKSEEETLKEEIKLSGGGDIDSSNPIINLIKYDSNHINDRYYNFGSRYKSPNESWIEFDFGEKQINLTSYTIRSNGSSPNSHAHPKTWTISLSNDRSDWTVVDKQVNNPILNGSYKQHRFEIKNNNNKYYRYIRYHQDDSWDNNKDFQYSVYISCIEFFGSIITPTNKP